MKAAKRQVEEINRVKTAIEKTESAHLKNDYAKNINRLTAELREYCGYRGYDFRRVIKGDYYS